MAVSISTNSLKAMAIAMMMMGVMSSLSSTALAKICIFQLPGLVAQCKHYVEPAGPQEPPSKKCCKIVKKVDIHCVCGYVTPKIEKHLSLEKVLFVAKSCGLEVEPGTKCGSFIAPPVAPAAPPASPPKMT